MGITKKDFETWYAQISDTAYDLLFDIVTGDYKVETLRNDILLVKDEEK